MYKGLTVLNMKGGVGKTTVAVNLGWAAASKGLKTLIVDLDPQANASVYLMGDRLYKEYIDNNGLTVVDIFEYNPSSIRSRGPIPTRDNVICKTVNNQWFLRRNNEPRISLLHLIPSHLEFAETLKRSAGRETALANFLDRYKDDYDLVIVDPPPTDSMATLSAYLSTQHILVPVKPEFLCEIGFTILARSIKAFNANNIYDRSLNVVGMFLSDADKASSDYDDTKEATEEFAQENGWRFLENEIRSSQSYRRGARESTPITNTHHARYDVRGELNALASTVLESMGADVTGRIWKFRD